MVALNHFTNIHNRLANRTGLADDKGSAKKKILFATDLSPSTRDGLTWATLLARTFDAELLIVHVDTLPTPGEDLLYEEYRHGRAITKSRMRALKPTDPFVPFRQNVLFGEPATEILRLAEEEAVDLIVMGTHDRSAFMRLFHRSVAASVLRRATCPAFVFRQGGVSGQRIGFPSTNSDGDSLDWDR